jgi:hypothetical protein
MNDKDREEVDLIAEYEVEYGQPDNWSDDIEEEFNRKWDEIQNRYR